MTRQTLSTLWRRGKTCSARLLLLSLASSSFLFTSCTTEEGIIAGALAGAAIGGIVGHSNEHSYARSNRYRGNYRYDNVRYHDNDRYYGRGRGGGYYQQRYSAYGGGGYRDPYCY